MWSPEGTLQFQISSCSSLSLREFFIHASMPRFHISNTIVFMEKKKEKASTKLTTQPRGKKKKKIWSAVIIGIAVDVPWRAATVCWLSTYFDLRTDVGINFCSLGRFIRYGWSYDLLWVEINFRWEFSAWITKTRPAVINSCFQESAR